MARNNPFFRLISILLIMLFTSGDICRACPLAQSIESYTLAPLSPFQAKEIQRKAAIEKAQFTTPVSRMKGLLDSLYQPSEDRPWYRKPVGLSTLDPDAPFFQWITSTEEIKVNPNRKAAMTVDGRIHTGPNSVGMTIEKEGFVQEVGILANHGEAEPWTRWCYTRGTFGEKKKLSWAHIDGHGDEMRAATSREREADEWEGKPFFDLYVQGDESYGISSFLAGLAEDGILDPDKWYFRSIVDTWDGKGTVKNGFWYKERPRFIGGQYPGTAMQYDFNPEHGIIADQSVYEMRPDVTDVDLDFLYYVEDPREIAYAVKKAVKTMYYSPMVIIVPSPGWIDQRLAVLYARLITELLQARLDEDKIKRYTEELYKWLQELAQDYYHKKRNIRRSDWLFSRYRNVSESQKEIDINEMRRIFTLPLDAEELKFTSKVPDNDEAEISFYYESQGTVSEWAERSRAVVRLELHKLLSALRRSKFEKMRKLAEGYKKQEATTASMLQERADELSDIPGERMAEYFKKACPVDMEIAKIAYHLTEKASENTKFLKDIHLLLGIMKSEGLSEHPIGIKHSILSFFSVFAQESGIFHYSFDSFEHQLLGLHNWRSRMGSIGGMYTSAFAALIEEGEGEGSITAVDLANVLEVDGGGERTVELMKAKQPECRGLYTFSFRKGDQRMPELYASLLVKGYIYLDQKGNISTLDDTHGGIDKWVVVDRDVNGRKRRQAIRKAISGHLAPQGRKINEPAGHIRIMDEIGHLEKRGAERADETPASRLQLSPTFQSIAAFYELGMLIGQDLYENPQEYVKGPVDSVTRASAMSNFIREHIQSPIVDRVRIGDETLVAEFIPDELSYNAEENVYYMPVQIKGVISFHAKFYIEREHGGEPFRTIPLPGREEDVYVRIEPTHDGETYLKPDDLERPITVEALPAAEDGIAPRGFYVTTNKPTSIFFDGVWVEVENPVNDGAIIIEKGNKPRAVLLNEIKKGDPVVLDKCGVKVDSMEKVQEKPLLSAGDVADRLLEIKKRNEKILLVCGPAVIHTGKHNDLAWLVENGFVDVFFAGNAVAVHDIERELFGTSLGRDIRTNINIPGGHEHHLRAINLLSGEGSIANTIQQGYIKSGLVFSLYKHNIPMVLAGSLRDDGPLPEVVTDTQEAIRRLRHASCGVSLALMLATTLHSATAAALLPSETTAVVVDVNEHNIGEVAKYHADTHGIEETVDTFISELRKALEKRIPPEEVITLEDDLKREYRKNSPAFPERIPKSPFAVARTVKLEGHLLDEGISSRVLGIITACNEQGETVKSGFKIVKHIIGRETRDVSKAELQIFARDEETMREILTQLERVKGVTIVEENNATLIRAEKDNLFPEGFLVTSNYAYQIRVDGAWIPVKNPKMDSGIRYDRETGSADTVKLCDVKKGDLFVVGEGGVREIFPWEEADATAPYEFQFMSSGLTPEKPITPDMPILARRISEAKEKKQKVMVVAGENALREKGNEYMVRLIKGGFIDILSCGNGFILEDAIISKAKKLGRKLSRKERLYLINEIRSRKSLREARKAGLLGRVVSAAIDKDVPLLLAGSMRDINPLPDVTADTIDSQRMTMKHLEDVNTVIFLATTLHAIGTGNLLPYEVTTVAVDTNQAVLTKLSDRGTSQAWPFLAKASYFLERLCDALGQKGENLVPETEQAYAINTAKRLEALQAGKDSELSFIALGTDWIKGYDENNPRQYVALNPLVTSLAGFCERRGIQFEYGDDTEVADRVKRIKAANSEARGIVLAGEDMVRMLSLEDDKNVFLGGVNNENLTVESYMPIMEMLELLLMLLETDSIDEKAVERAHERLGVRFERGKTRYIFFTPERIVPEKYDTLEMVYKLQTFA
ncbi:MAG: hypothetical protein JW994_03070 [Candidatus Omnitrophica bacterium]|nr:hypothetical protein [Candidatus Omnitrophota bacterium]